MDTKTLDLGCGPMPKNPYNKEIVYGIDFKENKELNIYKADLAIEPIPFEDNTFDVVTAFDFLEHIPRVIYNPTCRFPFVELMNEIYRVLKPEGIFHSLTPAYPAPEAFQDPTHVNIITERTVWGYFCNPWLGAKIYGFKGKFDIVHQYWSMYNQSTDSWESRDSNNSHLTIVIKKVV